MFGKGLFKKSRKGQKDDEASASVLPQHAVTSSFATGCGEEYSLAGHSFGQLSPDPIISPTKHRAPLSSYAARSILREPDDKQIVNDFDDISSMNDSIYFGADSHPIPGFSSPVRAELHSAMLGNCMSPGESTILNDNDTDIQTVATGHAFSTVISPSVRSELRSDVESTMSRAVGPLKTDTSPSESESGETEQETPANSPKEKEEPQSSKNGLCARLWRAPLWIRFVFFGSMILFLAAVLLAIIGLVVTSGSTATKSSNSASQISTGDDDGFNPTFVPDVPSSPPPVDDPVELEPEPEEPIVPEEIPEGEEDTGETEPTTGQDFTSVPTTSPVAAIPVFSTSSPSVKEQQKSKSSPTNTPVASPVQTFAPALVSQEAPAITPPDNPPEIVVYITAGSLPLFLKNQAETLLPKLPGSAVDSFLVHLGDWNDLNNGASCSPASFQTIADFYKISSVPVYWTVGDNEFNDCPDPVSALQLWKQSFVGYETKHWEQPPWTVLRQGDLSTTYSSYTENVAFIQGQVAYVTLNLVGSRVHDTTEFESRIQANLAWVEFSYDLYKDSANTMVIFAHSGPDNGNRFNKQFYDDLFAVIEDKYDGMTFVLVNRGTNSWGIEEKFDGIKNLYSVSVPGPIFPPMKLVIRDGTPTIVEEDWSAL